MIAAPYGINTGGHPDTPHSETPVEIDGIEYRPVSDPTQFTAVSATTSGSGVNRATTDVAVAETKADAMYQTETWGHDLMFDVTVENGIYDVKLHFAEIYWEEEGKRVFDVLVQGLPVHVDLDIVAETGDDHVAMTTIVEDVPVRNNQLIIATYTDADNSKFSGFAIKES
jgi:hypothetical protein